MNSSGLKMSRTPGSGHTTRSASISTSATAPTRSAGADTLDHTVEKITHLAPQVPPTQLKQRASRQLLADLQSVVSTHRAETDNHYVAHNAEQKTTSGLTARNDGNGMKMTEIAEDGASYRRHHRIMKNSFTELDAPPPQDLLMELLAFSGLIAEDRRRRTACCIPANTSPNPLQQ